jgi:4-aminobutyrate aminotransferase/(S)-3-amino-2-methylpropionate transaminase
LRRLRGLQTTVPAIGDVRGLGLMIGVELVKGDRAPDKDLNARIRKICLDSGLVVLSCGIHDNVIRLVPPLTLSEAELEEGWQVLQGAFQEVAR